MTTGGAITIVDADVVQIDASAARALTATAAVSIATNVDGILLDGGANTVTLTSGTDNDITLSGVTDDGLGGTGASLTLVSEGTAVLSTIDLADTADGALSITVDSDDADAEAES